ncbi:MAG: FkbM family methyltransferase [Chthonomonadetes bacterium]|nr:FkbM family methyltransferase [Chthonomonadetes bacterium]
MLSDFVRRLWNTVGIYKAKHPLITGMWFVGGKLFSARQPTEEERFLVGMECEGKVVYDIGANVGLMTLFFARAVGPTGYVVAFEPHPYSFRRLSRNVRVNRLRHVRLVNVGVGDETTSLILYQPSRHLSGAAFSGGRVFRPDEGQPIEFTVHVDTLDNLIKRFELPTPDYVKVDVEGYEVRVLRGAMQTIQQHKPAFFIEIHRLAGDMPTTGKVIEILDAYGYTFYHVVSGVHIGIDTCQDVRGGHLYCMHQR